MKKQSGFSDTEIDYQKLWEYFDHTNIKERKKNTKLHIQHVPKRLKYLTEKKMF
jgi:hypothetical protein